MLSASGATVGEEDSCEIVVSASCGHKLLHHIFAHRQDGTHGTLLPLSLPTAQSIHGCGADYSLGTTSKRLGVLNWWPPRWMGATVRPQEWPHLLCEPHRPIHPLGVAGKSRTASTSSTRAGRQPHRMLLLTCLAGCCSLSSTRLPRSSLLATIKT